MRLGYVIVYTPDVSAALTFYEQAFGLRRRFLHEAGDYGEFETGETVLAFAHEGLAAEGRLPMRGNRSDEPAAGIELALVTEQVEVAYRVALAAGAVAVHAPVRRPWGQTVAYVRDRDGVLVELCSPVAG